MKYPPGDADTLMTEARAVGGEMLADQLNVRAAHVSAMLNEWDGKPPEPPHFRATWSMAFRLFLDDHIADSPPSEHVPPPAITSIHGVTDPTHERRSIAAALQSALHILTDAELRDYLEGVVRYLQR